MAALGAVPTLTTAKETLEEETELLGWCTNSYARTSAQA